MTAAEFRTLHDDMTRWTTADHETYEHLATIDAAAPQPANVHVLAGGTTRGGKSLPAPQLRKAS